MKPKNVMPLRILLIQDNEDDRVAFEHALKKGNIDRSVSVCKRAEEAESRLTNANDTFDLVVTESLRWKKSWNTWEKIHSPM